MPLALFCSNLVTPAILCSVGWMVFLGLSATSGGAPHVNEMGLNALFFLKEILECLVVMKLYK